MLILNPLLQTVPLELVFDEMWLLYCHFVAAIDFLILMLDFDYEDVLLLIYDSVQVLDLLFVLLLLLLLLFDAVFEELLGSISYNIS